jgi:putative endonuclease
VTDARRRDAVDRGRRAEALAQHHLRQHRLRVVARNYRCRQGELDLVCLDGEIMVFVEVRYRRRDARVSAAESIDRTKQRRLRAAAAHFLASHRKHAARRCRFDVVTVTGQDPDIELHWLKSAFVDE